MTKVLVTGANGFVGRALSDRLRDVGCFVRKAVRDVTKLAASDPVEHNKFEWMVLHDQSSNVETQQALQSVQVVVHLAARVHVMADYAADPLREFRLVNTDWTERLARMAASQGVRRFVYMSSIKVNGEQSRIPFAEQHSPDPQDPYAVSKWEAEQALAKVSAQTGLEIVIIRSPLVYGPGVGGNFLQLLKIVRRGVPLPLATIHNQRSFIYRENLVDAVVCCVRHLRAAGQTYLVSDGEDLSTAELIRRLGKALRETVRLWPFPAFLLRFLGMLLRKQAAVDRLLGSLQINSSKIRQELNWQPPFSVDQGLAETAAWYARGAAVDSLRPA